MVIRLIIKWFLITLTVVASFFSAGLTAYQYLKYGPNDYSHYPESIIAKLIWMIGLPGSLVIFLLSIGSLVYFIVTVFNWIFFGKFKYSIND